VYEELERRGGFKFVRSGAWKMGDVENSLSGTDEERRKGRKVSSEVKHARERRR